MRNKRNRKNKTIIPIMISGAYTSGKATLASLLEGHSKIFTIPHWHDMLIDIFLHYTKVIKQHENTLKPIRGKHERIIFLRKLLAQRDYPMLEQYALQQKILTLNSANYNNFLKFKFDFYNHDKAFFKSVFKLKNITLHNLISLFCKSFIDNWKDFKNTYENIKYFVSTSEPGFCKYETLFEDCKDIKVIYIKRNTEEWFLAYAKRLKNMLINGTNIDVLERLKNDRRLFSTIKMDVNYYKYQERYKDRFLIIDFNELILNHEAVIRQVAEFLNIEFEDILLKPTWLSKKLSSSYNLVGNVIDTKSSLDIDESLAKNALALLEHLTNAANPKKENNLKMQITKIQRKLMKLLPYFIYHKMVDKLTS